jgi:hypothetical protein
MSKASPISAEVMAGLIVDALVDAGLVARESFDAAAEIAATEIHVRQCLGNCIPSLL